MNVAARCHKGWKQGAEYGAEKGQRMNDRTTVRWHFALTSSCYLAGTPLLTHFVFPSGVSGVLFGFPLFTVTWLCGKRWGFVAAALGVALNFLNWLVVGSGNQAVSESGLVAVFGLHIIEAAVFAVFIFIIDAMKQREVRIHREVELSRDLLRITEEKYRTLIESAPAAITVVENGKVVFCNTRMIEILGYSHQEMIGMDVRQLVHRDDLHMVMERHSARENGKGVGKTVHRSVRKDGRIVWIEVLGLQLDWDGKPSVLYFASDITERRQAEEALRESQEKYRTLIEVAPEAICVVEDRKIIFCNSRMLEIFGYSESEMIGMDITRLMHKDDVEWVMERYSIRMEGKLIPKTVLRDVRKDGEVIWVETVGRKIEWEGRPAILYFSSDVTERKTLEEQFAQAQKMEAIGRLSGGVAHDFNNLLQVMLGATSLIKDFPDDRHGLQDNLRILEDAGKTAARLTQHLLAFSRKQVVLPKVINMSELVDQSQEILSRVLGDNFALTTLVHDATAHVRADTGQLQQIVMNLALNARDAMPEGGRVTIVIDTVAFPDMNERKISPGDYVRLSVVDTGIGMDEATLDRIFEPFFTTKGLGKGTGLGLSIVYGIVKQWGGTIEVQSTLGAGSTFTVYLPRVLRPKDENNRCKDEESTHGSAAVLLVEDQAQVRRLVKQFLVNDGYTVVEAESGEKALKACTAHAGRLDLLLTDIVLSGMHGGEVADRVRGFFPGIRVIFMTGYAETTNALPLADAQILLKPFSAAELLSRVRAALVGC